MRGMKGRRRIVDDGCIFALLMRKDDRQELPMMMIHHGIFALLTKRQIDKKGMIDNGIFASAISETIKRKILRFFTFSFSTLVVSNRSTIAKPLHYLKLRIMRAKSFRDRRLVRINLRIEMASDVGPEKILSTGTRYYNRHNYHLFKRWKSKFPSRINFCLERDER